MNHLPNELLELIYSFRETNRAALIRKFQIVLEGVSIFKHCLIMPFGEECVNYHRCLNFFHEGCRFNGSVVYGKHDILSSFYELHTPYGDLIVTGCLNYNSGLFILLNEWEKYFQNLNEFVTLDK